MVVRKGDTVRVRAGDFKNTLGKVTESDIKALRVYVEGIDRRKNNGKMVPVALHPSQVPGAEGEGSWSTVSVPLFFV